jgi:hypothetical protein
LESLELAENRVFLLPHTVETNDETGVRQPTT